MFAQAITRMKKTARSITVTAAPASSRISSPESHQGSAPSAICLRVGLGQLSGDQLHFGSGFGYRHACGETARDVEGPVVTVGYRDEVQGDPEIVGPAVEEIRRHDADDGVRIPIQDNRRSDHGRI